MAKVTNRSGLHLEDVYITGILRSKLNRGHQNIKPISYDGANRKLNYYMGPFSWHLPGLKRRDLDIIWKIVINLMTCVIGNEKYPGYWPSAKTLNATVTEDILIPIFIEDQRQSFFEKNFASFKYCWPVAARGKIGREGCEISSLIEHMGLSPWLFL